MKNDSKSTIERAEEKAGGREVSVSVDPAPFARTRKQSTAAGNQERLGEIFVTKGLLDEDQMTSVLEHQKRTGASFGDSAQSLGYLAPSDLKMALSAQFGYPCVPLADTCFSKELSTAYFPDDDYAEKLRSVRSELLALKSTVNGALVVSVLSPHSGDGRTHLVGNLGVSLAQLGKKVLIIDADLRNPRLHALFKLPNTCGISMLLSGRQCDQPLGDVPHFENLKVLPSGPVPPNPQELVSGSGMQALLRSARPRYDVILIDTPPAMSYSDAENVAVFSQFSLLVARRNKTNIHRLKDLTKRLRKKKVEVGGCVMVA